jgi:uncharacterized protein (TIGR01732 family)
MYYEMTPHYTFPLDLAYPYNVGALVQPYNCRQQPTVWSGQEFLLLVILFILLLIVGKIGWLAE